MATPLNVKKIQTLVNKFGDNLKQSNEQQVVHSLEQLIKDLTNEKNFFLNQEVNINERTQNWYQLLLSKYTIAEKQKLLNEYLSIPIVNIKENKKYRLKKVANNPCKLIPHSKNQIEKSILFIYDTQEFKEINFDEFKQELENENIKLVFYYLSRNMSMNILKKFPRTFACNTVICFDPYSRQFPAQSTVFLNKNTDKKEEFNMFKMGENTVVEDYHLSDELINLNSLSSFDEVIITKYLRESTNNWITKSPKAWVKSLNNICEKEILSFDNNYYHEYLKLKEQGDNIDQLIKENLNQNQKVRALGEVQKTHFPFIASAKQSLIASNITIIASSNRVFDYHADSRGNFRDYATPSLNFECSNQSRTINLKL